MTVSVQPTEIRWRIKRGDLPKPGPRSARVEIDVSTHNAADPADIAWARVPRSAGR